MFIEEPSIDSISFACNANQQVIVVVDALFLRGAIVFCTESMKSVNPMTDGA